MSLENVDNNRGKSTSTGRVWAHRIHIDPNDPTRILFSYHLEGVIDFKRDPVDPNLKEIHLSTPLSKEETEKVYKHNSAEATGVEPSRNLIIETNIVLPRKVQQRH